MRGRIPKPEKMRELEGDRSKRPPKGKEMQIAPGAPVMPKDLDKDAAAEWRRIVPALAGIGMLSKLDRAALAEYCRCWGIVERAHRTLVADGDVLTTANGYKYPHPAIGIVKGHTSILRGYLAEFGLTPAARARLVMRLEPTATEKPDYVAIAKARWSK